MASGEHFVNFVLTKRFTKLLQSNLCITALYIAVTLCTTVTEQLPKNYPSYMYVLLSSPAYSGHLYNLRGDPLDFLNPQFHCFLPVYDGQCCMCVRVVCVVA